LGLVPEEKFKVNPPPVVKDAGGGMAGLGDVSGDEFVLALERSTPPEYRDEPKAEAKPADAPGEKPAAAPVEGEKPAVEQPKADAKPAATPKAGDEPKDDKKPADAQPKADAPPAAAAAPVALDPGEKINLGKTEGGADLEYSRAQLANLVVQYPDLLEGANEAVKFRQIFGVPTIAEAEKTWAPLLQRINSEPQFQKYVTDVLVQYGKHGADPEFVEYLGRCFANWEEGPGPQDGAPAQPAPNVDQEARRRLEAIEQRDKATQQQQQQQQVNRYIQAEVAQLQHRDPRLKDQDALKSIWNHAIAMQRSQPGYTLTQAAVDCELLIARLTEGNRTPPPVPALAAGGGAAPRATAQQIDPNEQVQYKDMFDPRMVNDWLKHRKAMGFE
jgi:hypothetical protein